VEWTDYALLALVAVSALVGLWRGFIKEAFSLAVWIAAFLIAYQFAGPVADMMRNSVDLPSARHVLAFGGVFITVLVIGGLLTFLAGKLVEKTGLSGSDRLMGGIFGAVRGLVIILMLILAAGFTPIPQDPWWQESVIIEGLLPLADWVGTLLPESISEHLDLYAAPGEEAAV